MRSASTDSRALSLCERGSRGLFEEGSGGASHARGLRYGPSARGARMQSPEASQVRGGQGGWLGKGQLGGTEAERTGWISCEKDFGCDSG